MGAHVYWLFFFVLLYWAYCITIGVKGYLAAKSDMAGFSLQEQAFLARLINFHRRQIAADFSDADPFGVDGGQCFF